MRHARTPIVEPAGSVRSAGRLVALSLLAASLACPGPRTPVVKQPPPPPEDPVVTEDPPPGEPTLPLWDRVRRGVLDNGLTYYVLPHTKPERRAYLWLAVNAGSVQEDDDQRGLAHFVEHMAFNGTARFAENDLIDYLEKNGVRFGPDLNAYTSFDQTVYQLQVPTDDPALVATGLDILRDWAGAISFTEEEVEKERGVVLEEWRLGRGANARLFDKQAPVLFKGSRYAERLVIGKPEILQGAPRDTLVRYYKDWYRPDLMAVIVVGDIDPDKLEAEISSRFADLAATDKPRARPRGEVPAADGMRVSIETDPEATRTGVAIYNLFAHRPEATRSDVRRFLTERLYHAMLNERFDQLREDPESPFTSAGSSTSSFVREIDAFSRSASVKDGKVDAAIEALFTEVLRVERHGFTATELERAKKRMLRGYKRSAKEQDKQDGRALTDELTRHFFEAEFVIGAQAEYELAAELVPAITLDELDTLARAWGGEENRVVLITGPDGAPMPTEARVREIAAAVAEKTLEPWTDEMAGKALIAAAPAAGAIAGERTLDAFGVTEWTLSNGIRVVVKPTDFDNDTVLVNGFSLGGTVNASDKLFPTARFADAVIGVGGVGDLSQVELDKLLSGQVVSVATWIGEIEEGVSASGSPEDLETLFQLLHQRIVAPRKDEQAFTVWKQRQREWIKNRRLSPETSFFEDIDKVFTKDHLRRRPAEAADLDKIDLDKALTFYRDRFGDVGDFTFVIVGNVELATLRPLVETYLASLPGAGRKDKEKHIGLKRPKKVVKKTIQRGREPKSYVSLIFHGKQAWSRDDDRDMRILGDVLRIRLREVLREEMGGVYGVSVGGSINRRAPPERTFGVRFGCSPENVDKLRTAVFDEIARLKKDGVDDDHLERVRKLRVRAREVDLRENRAWLSWLSSAYRYGDELEVVLDLEAELARASSANVQAAAARFLDEKRYVLGVLEPDPKLVDKKVEKPTSP